MPGQKDGWALFHRTLLATSGGPTTITALNWHLKVKDIEDHVGLAKNCITISKQTINSIHKLITKIQQILGSH